MPLRDHFRPPVWRLASWEGFELRRNLPGTSNPVNAATRTSRRPCP